MAKAQTFRRSKLTNWIRLQNKITEAMLEDLKGGGYPENVVEFITRRCGLRTDMMIELMKEFNIQTDELQSHSES